MRESGMLALGALSTGCLAEMGQYLPQLFPFLIQVCVKSLSTYLPSCIVLHAPEQNSS